MNILLTGATGFLGYRTLERLVQLPNVNKIVATGRILRKSREILNPKVEYVLGDLEDKLFVSNILKDIDIVINTASLSSPWGSEDDFLFSECINPKTYH